MNRSIRILLAAAILASAPRAARAQTTAPFFPAKIQTTPIPDEFTDPETHLRILHLTRFPTNYGGVEYFTYDTFSADSRLALIDAQYKDKWRYLYTFDFGSMTVKPLVTDRLTQNQVVAPKSGNVYYEADGAAWVVPLAGGTPRKICDIPERWYPGVGLTVNSNETLLLGGSTDTDRSTVPPGTDFRNGPNVLFTINIKTGELKIVHRENHWFGHVQFSPTDPDLCMFCHEGSWVSVDRIWLIHPSKSTVDAQGDVTSDAWLAFKRSDPHEIAGHEFWSPDGRSLWFQHGYRGGTKTGSFLARVDIATGKLTDFTIPDGFSGIHQTFSPDGAFLVSDGSGKEKTGPDKYISRLTLPTDGSRVLTGQHLATLQANDYAVEPNPHVSPDDHWVTFTATLHGTPQAYAIELPRQ